MTANITDSVSKIKIYSTTGNYNVAVLNDYVQSVITNTAIAVKFITQSLIM